MIMFQTWFNKDFKKNIFLKPWQDGFVLSDNSKLNEESIKLPDLVTHQKRKKEKVK